MVLTGKTNKAIVTLLNRQGAKAVGLSGKGRESHPGIPDGRSRRMAIWDLWGK